MILQALNGYYNRMAAREESKIAPPGYSYQPISFVVLLSLDGDVVDIQDIRKPSPKGKMNPASLLVPQWPKRSGKKPKSAFMSDKAAYVFGVERKSDAIVRNDLYRGIFNALHVELLGKEHDAGCVALLRFLEKWQPQDFSGLRHASEVAGQNVAFRLDGETALLHQRSAFQSVWARRQKSAVGKSAVCLVTGIVSPIARLHPSIKQVEDAQSSGASIVSFNQKSFESFGKEQGANAPVSEAAAFAYTTALNELLRRDSKQRVQIGDATTVFWAEADRAEDAEAAEFAAAFMIAPSPAQLDDQATTRLAREVMQSLEQGRPLANPELHLDPASRFYILGLSPNAARLSIRFWEATTLGALGNAFHLHWRDLRLEPQPMGRLPPSVAALALRTAPARIKKQGDRKLLNFDRKSVAPRIAGELMRAILTKGRYPGSLLANVVMRVRTDHVIDHTRASLIKASIVRAMRLEGRLPQENYLVRTDPDDPNVARRLGRLFAVLERTQAAALGDNINATIKDKYLGAAAATPSRVFPGLITNAAHHTARLRKGHTDAKWVKKPAAAGFALDRDIGRLVAQFNDGFPSQQSIEEQGLFVVGYYQERFGGRPDPDVGGEAGIDIPQDDSTDHEQE